MFERLIQSRCLDLRENPLSVPRDVDVLRLCHAIYTTNSHSSHARFVANLNIIGALFHFGTELVGCQAQLGI